jgi:hypothetical protein
MNRVQVRSRMAFPRISRLASASKASGVWVQFLVHPIRGRSLPSATSLASSAMSSPLVSSGKFGPACQKDIAVRLSIDGGDISTTSPTLSPYSPRPPAAADCTAVPGAELNPDVWTRNVTVHEIQANGD